MSRHRGLHVAHRRARVTRVLDELGWKHGLPRTITVYNGPEFISHALDRWAYRHGVTLHFIQPGKPTQNGHVESFNGRFREECLSQAYFPTLARARAEIEIWRVDYNTKRPHSAIGYETPAAFAARSPRAAPPTAGAAAASVIGEPEAPCVDPSCGGGSGGVHVN